MKTTNLVSIIIRIAAIWLVIQGISYIPTSAAYFASYGEYTLESYSFVTTALPSLVYLVIAILMWRFSSSISRLVVEDDESSVGLAGMLTVDLLRIGIQIVGICWIMIGISDLAWNIMQLRYEGLLETDPNYMMLPSTATGITSLIEIVAGGILLMRSKTLSRLMERYSK